MRLVASFQPNYFSIEDILATQSTVPCKIEVKIPRLGDLDQSSQSQHLEPGRKLELPTWLAFGLSKRRLITAELSKAYTAGTREILKAEPAVVDLIKHEQYFYELGRLLCSLVPAEEEELRASILGTFQLRSREILSLSQASPSSTVLAREQLLSREERALMLAGRQRWTEIEAWLSGKVSCSELAASSVSNYRKRKRTDGVDE